MRPPVTRLPFAPALYVLGVALAGCTSIAGGSATPTATDVPPTVAPTPTKEVALVVQVTGVPTHRQKKVRAKPTATPFVTPKAAYIALMPASGPPLSKSVRLIGGNLPKRVPVDMLWSPKGHKSATDTVIYTGPRGNIDVSFTVPMSPPGTYALVAQVDGRPYASTTYQVASHAALSVTTSPSGSRERLEVQGRHFIPNFKLSLVAYPTEGKQKPIVLGMVHSSPSGTFLFRTTTSQLPPGQYILRSWSVSDLAAQMAETVFEVEV